MRLVKAGLNELNDLCTLVERFYDYMSTQEPFMYKRSKANKEFYQSKLSSEMDLYMLAYDLDTPIGFFHVAEKSTAPIEFYVPHKFAVLMELFVEVHYRGTDISNRLMAEAKKWTKKRNLDYLELRVLTLDEFACKLYEQEGFDITQHTMRCLMK